MIAFLLLAQLQQLPQQLISLESEAGQKIFAQAEGKRDFFALAGTFEQQESQSFCGVASSVAVLNAMPLLAPELAGGYRGFTQSNVFDEPARKAIARGGLTVEQLAAALRSQGVEARAMHADATTLRQFREEAAGNVAKTGDYILVDFLRTKLGQDFGAHWSPLAAYDSATDRFLVLDVNRRRYPPYWVKAGDLFDAMNTFDPDAAATRGYVVVEPRPGMPARVAVPPIKGKLLTFVIAAAVLIFSLGVAAGRFIRRAR
jgi:hypothetical protein